MSSLKKFQAILEVNRKLASGDIRLPLTALGFPLLIIFLVGLLFFNNHKSPLGVIDLDKGPVGKEMMYLFKEDNNLTLRYYSSGATLKDDVLRQRVVAGIIIPPNLSSSALSKQLASVTLIAPIGNQNSADARMDVTELTAIVSSQVTSAVISHKLTGLPMNLAYQDAVKITNKFYSTLMKKTQTSMGNPYSYTSASQTVLFAFLTVGGAGSALVDARRLGLIKRMIATPIRPWVIVLAYFSGTFLLGIAQIVGLLFVGHFMFGVSFGPFPGLVLLVLALALSASSIGILFGVLSSSTEQALAISIVLGIALGMLGGCLWPLSIVGPTMKLVGHFAPQAWAMDAFITLIFSHGGLSAILKDLIVLIGFSCFFILIGILQFRKYLTVR
jgi:ABC-2 type transport system permease protein